MTKRFFDFLTRYGLAGLIGGLFVVIILAIIPNARSIYEGVREQDRKDSEVKEISCQSMLKQTLDKLELMEEDMAEIRVELGMQRRADYSSVISRWRLNADLELIDWNPKFAEKVFKPAHVNPYLVKGKRWDEFLPDAVAKPAMKSDEWVKKHEKPKTDNTDFTIEQRDDGAYKVFWVYIKEPLFDDFGEFKGLRGQAQQLYEEKIE